MWLYEIVFFVKKSFLIDWFLPGVVDLVAMPKPFGLSYHQPLNPVYKTSRPGRDLTALSD